jgi:hypothetical protein
MIRYFTVLTATACLSVAAFASDYTFNCKQRTDRTPVDASMGEISVVVSHVKTLATATEYHGQYFDAVDLVKVVVSSTKNGKTTVVSSTLAKAMSEDVDYAINNNGIDFQLYLDEMEEASITTKIKGKRTEVSLVCE